MTKRISTKVLKNIENCEITKSMENLILSASGWRKVFADDLDEESKSAFITDEDKIIISAMAYTFGKYLKKTLKNKTIRVAVAMDTRPTGNSIANIIIKTFINLNLKVAFPGICSAPEIMAYARNDENIHAFIYISASHNPIGHNGIKFGLDNGGVLEGTEVSKLIKSLKENISDINLLRRFKNIINSTDTILIDTVYKLTKKYKKESYKTYFDFSKEVISYNENIIEAEEFYKTLKQNIKKTKLGIIAELNGSARTVSIDKRILKGCNIKLKLANAKPGQITHRIVPEGASLNQCRDILEKMHKKDKSFILGYVPDCDGDRGNIVYFNEDNEKAEILQAQEVFALSCLAELSYLEYKKIESKVAVAVNGPTSMRIDEICSFFKAECFRAEVGEANIVNLARNLRSQKYAVRILGEGSNGGNISHPAAVRDPINTIFSIIKLLSIRSNNKTKGLFEIWCEKSNQKDLYKENYSLTDIIKSLPQYITTSAFEDKAILKINTMDHSLLKENYENIFQKEWEVKKKKLLKKYGISDWEEHNYEALEDKKGTGKQFRSGTEKGGLKIIFKNKNKENIAYIWMRGSGTEPVFRILADVKGQDKNFEEYLLNWQRELVKKADSL